MTAKFVSLFLLGSIITTSTSAFAALPWPKAAVTSLQMRMSQGTCYDADSNPFSKDVCATYKIKSGVLPKSRTTMSQPQPSQLVLENGRHKFKVARTDLENEFMINSIRFNPAKAKSHAELKTMIQKAMAKKIANNLVPNVWIESAYAQDLQRPEEQEISGLIQLLVAETEFAADCEQFLQFGTQCEQDLTKVNAALRSNPKNQAMLIEVNKQMNLLKSRFESSVWPTVDGYDHARYCAFKLKGDDRSQSASDKAERSATSADRAIRACRTLVVQTTEISGGSKDSENIVVWVANMFFGQHENVPSAADLSTKESRQ